MKRICISLVFMLLLTACEQSTEFVPTQVSSTMTPITVIWTQTPTNTPKPSHTLEPTSTNTPSPARPTLERPKVLELPDSMSTNTPSPEPTSLQCNQQYSKFEDAVISYLTSIYYQGNIGDSWRKDIAGFKVVDPNSVYSGTVGVLWFFIPSTNQVFQGLSKEQFEKLMEEAKALDIDVQIVQTRKDFHLAFNSKTFGTLMWKTFNNSDSNLITNTCNTNLKIVFGNNLPDSEKSQWNKDYKNWFHPNDVRYKRFNIVTATYSLESIATDYYITAYYKVKETENLTNRKLDFSSKDDRDFLSTILSGEYYYAFLTLTKR